MVTIFQPRNRRRRRGRATDLPTRSLSQPHLANLFGYSGPNFGFRLDKVSAL
jgi:hypothetical protein